MPSRNPLHLEIEHSGSCEHFYHFLLGFFVPLVNFLYVDQPGPDRDEILIRSCGPMDRIIDELRSPVLKTVERRQHRALRSEFAHDDRLMLYGLDHPDTYDRAGFLKATAAVRALLGEQVQQETDRLGPIAGGSPRVLLIERLPAAAFYSSPASEIKTAGAERRSIANQTEVERWLAREFGNCINVGLEDTTLARQIALFSAADVIVAQHGAALGNLIWSRPGTCIAEINIDTGNSMERLAHCMELRYVRVSQSGLHGDADLDGLAAIRGALREAV